MVAEPKPHQTGRKRQNVSKTGNDWDYYYDRETESKSHEDSGNEYEEESMIRKNIGDKNVHSNETADVTPSPSYYASASLPSLVPRNGPPAKRPRLLSSKSSKSSLSPPPIERNVEFSTAITNDHYKKYSNPDILICGNCRELFTEIHDLLEHKKTYCKLRFTCKCRPQSLNGCTEHYKSPDIPSPTLLCTQCLTPFPSAWDLLIHVQLTHALNIYSLRNTSPQDSPGSHEHQDHDTDATDLPQRKTPSPAPLSDKEGDSNSGQSSIHDNGSLSFPIIG